MFKFCLNLHMWSCKSSQSVIKTFQFYLWRPGSLPQIPEPSALPCIQSLDGKFREEQEPTLVASWASQACLSLPASSRHSCGPIAAQPPEQLQQLPHWSLNCSVSASPLLPRHPCMLLLNPLLGSFPSTLLSTFTFFFTYGFCLV